MPASASLGLTAFGTASSASASQQSGAYQAQVAANNQVIANQNADLALFKGNQAEQQSRQRTAQMVGADRAGFGASGVDPNSGSAVRVQSDTARIGEMDAQTIADNAQRSAWGFQRQAEAFGAESQFDTARGEQGAMASLIGGGADFAAKWTKYRTKGGGG